MIVALVCALVYITLAALVACANFEFSLVSPNLLASVQPWFELRMLLYRTMMVIVYNFAGDSIQVQSLLLFLFLGLIVFEYVRYVREARAVMCLLACCGCVFNTLEMCMLIAA